MEEPSTFSSASYPPFYWVLSFAIEPELQECHLKFDFVWSHLCYWVHVNYIRTDVTFPRRPASENTVYAVGWIQINSRFWAENLIKQCKSYQEGHNIE